jgi:hypothetical protein
VRLGRVSPSDQRATAMPGLGSLELQLLTAGPLVSLPARQAVEEPSTGMTAQVRSQAHGRAFWSPHLTGMGSCRPRSDGRLLPCGDQVDQSIVNCAGSGAGHPGTRTPPLTKRQGKRISGRQGPRARERRLFASRGCGRRPARSAPPASERARNTSRWCSSLILSRVAVKRWASCSKVQHNPAARRSRRSSRAASAIRSGSLRRARRSADWSTWDRTGGPASSLAGVLPRHRLVPEPATPMFGRRPGEGGRVPGQGLRHGGRDVRLVA